MIKMLIQSNGGKVEIGSIDRLERLLIKLALFFGMSISIFMKISLAARMKKKYGN